MPPSPIFGGFYQARSLNLADNICMNLFPGVVDAGQGQAKAPGALYNTPGLTLLTTVGTGAVGAMHFAPEIGNLFVVSGGFLYSVTPALVATQLGAVPNTSTGLSQAFVWSSTGGFSAVTLPFTPTSVSLLHPQIIDNGTQVMVGFGLSLAFQDGFGLMNQPGTQNIWQSNSLDFTTWNALNFGQAFGDSDTVVAITQIRREVFAIKDLHTQVFINQGNNGFVFGTLDGVYLKVGTASPATLTQIGEGLAWLAQNAEGEAIAVMASPYNPVPISNRAVERIWQGYGLSAIKAAYAYAYQSGGRLFWVLTFPGKGTWVYDVFGSAAAKFPLWHQRGQWISAGGYFAQHQSSCYAFFNGNPIVGDSQSGNIYILDDNNLTDNGAMRKWQRSWRARPQPSDDPTSFKYLRIDMQSGISVPDGTSPQCSLSWSDDGGHNFSQPMIRAVGAAGDTAHRLLFTRMGSTRRSTGLDRIFLLESSDQFPVAIVGAELR